MTIYQVSKISHKRGDNFEHKVNLPTVDFDNNAIDYSGATFLAQVRVSEAKTAALLSACTIDSSHTDEDPAYVLLSVVSATEDMATGKGSGTEDWPAGATVFMDLQVTRNGKPETPGSWKIKVIPDTSR